MPQSIVPFYEAVPEDLKGTFEAVQEPFFSVTVEILYGRMGRHCSECGNEHHTLDSGAGGLNGSLQKGHGNKSNYNFHYFLFSKYNLRTRVYVHSYNYFVLVKHN